MQANSNSLGESRWSIALTFSGNLTLFSWLLRSGIPKEPEGTQRERARRFWWVSGAFGVVDFEVKDAVDRDFCFTAGGGVLLLLEFDILNTDANR